MRTAFEPRDAHRAIAALALIGVAAGAAPARAQNNSLFANGAGQAQPAPTTQPAGQPPSLLNGEPALRPKPVSSASGNVVNPVLLNVSPFAVEPPQPRKIEVGSFVTIIVREDKSATSDSNLKSEKDWTMNSELSKWIRINGDLRHKLVPQTFPDGTPGVEFDFENSWEGKGKYGRKDSLTFRIQVKVLDVKPNGNLVLEGRKELNSDEEGYTATLVGECRSEDVTAQNTVLSTQVYDLHVDVKHRGGTRDAARRGWLMRAFDFLRPI